MVTNMNKLGCMFNVRDHGAVGDGLADDTCAIQAAFDACGEHGGGTVLFPAGRYLTGTVALGSNMTIEISAGARVIGSAEIEDYHPDPLMKDSSFRGYLLGGDGLKNVTITGEGEIDGQGSHFWYEEMCNATARKPKENRPHTVVQFSNSQNVRLHGITLLNAPTYSVWLLGCEDVSIDQLRIDNPYDGPNTDGLDIDCCENVTISNCHISAGDDCIAIKSDTACLGREAVCKNVVVTNCILFSSTCGVRVGYEGDGLICDCTFSNLVINKANKAIDILSVLPGELTFTDIDLGAKIERIRFFDITAENVKRGIYIWAGREIDGELQGYIRHVTICNFTAVCEKGSYIGCADSGKISDISLSDVKLKIVGSESSGEMTPAGVWDVERLNHGLYCKQIDGLLMNNLLVDLSDAQGCWKGEFLAEDVTNMVEK